MPGNVDDTIIYLVLTAPHTLVSEEDQRNFRAALANGSDPKTPHVLILSILRARNLLINGPERISVAADESQNLLADDSDDAGNTPRRSIERPHFSFFDRFKSKHSRSDYHLVSQDENQSTDDHIIEACDILRSPVSAYSSGDSDAYLPLSQTCDSEEDDLGNEALSSSRQDGYSALSQTDDEDEAICNSERLGM